ncbi:bifunctional hydroxymethylpyrimidine kinase/phosphomethylpyrimidine kinase [Sphingomonas profundi]|uniref:bifunctional hydroxymethylpyrimidine kinase/phosphomethylpyrimidine kinase n=1 Tax=Alterirhizorhabdus profundi TaxID=2681549 RepID=UPI0012E94AD8|nr:bifunctional hydroxymethylpyrimidine kinase/phosphomethylpyrimidine kinase [Sphingomonas profundi]
MKACPRILIVAGSDSGGGAGIQADIKTVTMLGGHAMTAITAVTAQNTLGVTGVWPLPAEAVLAQIDAVAADIGVDAVKIGMIGSAEVAEAVAARLGQPDLAGVPVVFDPVMIATSGSVLADAETMRAFTHLMTLATLITPNLPELAALAADPGGDSFDPIAAARAIARSSGAPVLVKGGHAEGALVSDRLVAPEGIVAVWEAARIETRHSHGTGCTLASGIATGLGAGLSLEQAIGRARDYVRAALLAAPGHGAGHGPMGHALGVAPFDVLRPASSPSA